MLRHHEYLIVSAYFLTKLTVC